MSRTVNAALVALEAELLEWPDFILEEIGRGHTWSSQEPAVVVSPDWWTCIVRLREGPKYGEHYQGNGKTMLASIDGLTRELISRRTEPHRWHLEDWMSESRFVIGCAECENEAHLIFDGKVEWESE